MVLPHTVQSRFLRSCVFCPCFFFKQKTAYEMRISDWSSDVCSSDLWIGSRSHPASSGAGGLLSAGWWLARRENRQLSVESTLEGGPRFAAGDKIGRASCRDSVCQDG